MTQLNAIFFVFAAMLSRSEMIGWQILLLYYSLQLKDREIAPLLGISRSKVQRDRKALFEELKSKMGK